MSGVATGPSTPQRPSSLVNDDASNVVSNTPTRLGLLQTPPRRFSRHLKRPINAVEPGDDAVPDSEQGSPGSVRLLATPPRRPPRRARFSTGLAEPTGFDVDKPATSGDREVSPLLCEARPKERSGGEEQTRVEEQSGGEDEQELDGLEQPGELKQLGELGQLRYGEKLHLSEDRQPREGDEDGDCDNLKRHNINERGSTNASVHNSERDGKLRIETQLVDWSVS
ncbi:hypothetical protein CFIO01_13730 [Colletotrichum fioriniae PJ7]|uniref:Uncharacterized protein n=1 Tax=Colletotrichum fioriniae PJ7 TaxID=1445577 RepID=A0A010RWX6_9PEZI|nr:hypothetical protein CFIO01_13730 [Colletotrichum fioriniae PJ7]